MKYLGLLIACIPVLALTAILYQEGGLLGILLVYGVFTATFACIFTGAYIYENW